MPETSPPPPTWTSTTSASGTSSSISSADRSLAGHHERVVVRMHERAAGLLDERSRCSNAAGMSGGESSTVAPYARRPRSSSATPSATSRRARRCPRRADAYASACAWLPAEMEITPRAFSSSLSVESLFSTPRGLKAPVRWRSSALKCTARRRDPRACASRASACGAGVRRSARARGRRRRASAAPRGRGDTVILDMSGGSHLRRIVTSVCRKASRSRSMSLVSVPSRPWRTSRHRGAQRVLRCHDARQQRRSDRRGRSRRELFLRMLGRVVRRYGWICCRLAYCYGQAHITSSSRSRNEECRDMCGAEHRVRGDFQRSSWTNQNHLFGR